jgi:hypothetical protein
MCFFISQKSSGPLCFVAPGDPSCIDSVSDSSYREENPDEKEDYSFRDDIG